MIVHQQGRIGSGAIADAYSADLCGYSVVYKVLLEQHAVDSECADSFRREAEVLAVLNAAENSSYTSLVDPLARARWAAATASQRIIVALLDQGVDGSGRPFIVQELAPPQVEVRPVQDLRDELRVLVIMRCVAQGLALAHCCHVSLRDFEPRTKINRIRVREDAEGRVLEVRLIDWNISGDDTTDNISRDMFHFGGHFYHLLLGQHLDLASDGRPPHTLGLGIAGWDTLSVGSRGILVRLLDRELARRYRTASDLVDDLTWLERAMSVTLQEPSDTRLRDWAYAARAQLRFDRLLAAADLALRFRPTGDTDRQLWATLQANAREELDKDQWQPLAMARVSLLAKQYGQAVANFDRELNRLDPKSEPARIARYLKLKAEVGRALRSAGIMDPDKQPEWSLLSSGVQSLIQRAWPAAVYDFQRAGDLNPDLNQIHAFLSLENRAAAGQLLEQAAQLRPAPSHDDTVREGWTERESERVKRLTEAVHLLEQATRLAPDEPFFPEMLRVYDRELHEREELLSVLRSAEESLVAGRYQDALVALKEAAKLAPRYPLLQRLMSVAQQQARFSEQMQRARAVLSRGEYAEAMARLQAADSVIPGDPLVIRGQHVAQAGLALQTWAENEIKKEREALMVAIAAAPKDGVFAMVGARKMALDRARTAVQAIADWPGKTISLLLAQTGLVAPMVDETDDILFVSNAALDASLREFGDQIAKVADDTFRDVQSELERSWRELRFRDASRMAVELKELAVVGQKEWIAEWVTRLDRCLKAQDSLVDECLAIRQRRDKGSTTTENPLDLVQGILERFVLQCYEMPEEAREQAQRLVEFIQTHRPPDSDAYFGLKPPVLPPALADKPLLRAPRDLLEDFYRVDSNAHIITAGGERLAYQAVQSAKNSPDPRIGPNKPALPSRQDSVAPTLSQVESDRAGSRVSEIRGTEVLHGRQPKSRKPRPYQILISLVLLAIFVLFVVIARQSGWLLVLPRPLITDSIPKSEIAGTEGLELRVIGQNFTQDSVVQWNGKDRQTTWNSKTELQTQISASDIADPGDVRIRVAVPGRGVSNEWPFEVLPMPTATLSLTPSSTPSPTSSRTPSPTLTPTPEDTSTPTPIPNEAIILYDYTAVYADSTGSTRSTISTVKKGTYVYICKAVGYDNDPALTFYQVALGPCHDPRTPAIGWVSARTVSTPIPPLSETLITRIPRPTATP